MSNIEELIYNYQDIINPTNLLQTQEEFNDFINIPATKEDLVAFLKICEDNDLYEWCISINNKIKNYGI